MNRPFQHRHLDTKLLKWVGNEHRLAEWSQKYVDGYYEDKASGERIVIEFLGGDLHGYPPLWEFKEDAVDRNGNNMQGNYYATSDKMSKVKELGYRVLYAWSADIDKKTKKSKLPNVFREFIKHLEWE